MNEVLHIIAVAAVLFYMSVCLKYELQMLQQNSYRNSRYWRWLKKDLYRFGRVADLALLLTVCFFADNIYVTLGAAAILAGKGVAGLRKRYKKKLVFTRRAQRLAVTSGIIATASILLASLEGPGMAGGFIAAVFMAAIPFLVMTAANAVNMPIEKSINRRYYNDAKRILAAMPRLRIIGITGSYGKTSTKHYLHRILSERFNVLMTPGSYNTTLGVVRTVREQLKPYHDIFIVEMGAKQRGDIRDICDLVHPEIGILTSIGEQHLESFGSTDNIQKTKFELIDALPAGGVAVLNDDFEYVANRKVENVGNVVRYGSENPGADYRLGEVRYTKEGADFSIVGKNGEAERFSTRIVGYHNLSNIMAGYIVAKHLGMKGDDIGYAIKSIQQVEHRLDIRQAAGGVTIIDDAFNSNPRGAEMALDVLSGFKTGKRIVVTPGMVELGEKEHEYNRLFGEKIAASCDYAVIVGAHNRQAISEGLEAGGFGREKIFEAATFDAAVGHLRGILAPGDTVLYENDLPDTYK